MYIKTMADAYKGDNFENPIEIHSKRTYIQASPRTFFDLTIIEKRFPCMVILREMAEDLEHLGEIEKNRINFVSALGSCLIVDR
jgi:hypothetical protein